MTSDIASSRVASTTLGDLLLTAADRQPDRMAIILPDRRMTYADLRDLSIQRQQLQNCHGLHARTPISQATRFTALPFQELRATQVLQQS